MGVRVSPWLFLRPAMVLAFAGVAAGAMVSSPIPSATVPPSTYGGGLINTPNPIDHSSNLPITGNVLGGKHFRGSIPYNSTTSFSAPLGSTSLDSFLRYSAVPEGLNGYPQNYSPFYSPSGTVTTMQPGYRGVFSAPSPRIAGGLTQYRLDQPLDTMSLTEAPQLSTSRHSAAIDPGLAISSQLRHWPMSRSSEEMKNIISDELGDQLTERSLSQPQGMTPDEYQRQLEKLRSDIDRVKANASRLVDTQNLASGPGTDVTAVPAQPGQESLRPLPPGPQPQQGFGQQRAGLPNLAPVPGDGETQNFASLQEGVTVQPGLRLYDPSAGSADTVAKPPIRVGQMGTALSPGVPPGSPADQDAAGRLPASQRVEEVVRSVDATARFLGHPPVETQNLASPDLASRQTADRLRGASGVEDLAEVDQSRTRSGDSQPRSENGVRPGPASSVTQSQFDHYVAAAELYMQQGRYYRAVDSFTLALVYLPHDSRAHLGRSHALLAAGEYLSSATFLARAVELDARTGTQNVAALRRLNLVEIVGGPDPFVQRITNLEENAQSNDAPQLQFLLAYVYYQMNEPAEARTAIQAARKGLPASAAVDLLEAVIGSSN